MASGLVGAQSSGGAMRMQASSASEPSCSFPAGRGLGAQGSGGSASLHPLPLHPPPADANGLALGIPVPNLPMAVTPTGKLPLLRVMPGRISATVTYSTPGPPQAENKPQSPAPHQQRLIRRSPGSSARRQQAPLLVKRPARKAARNAAARSWKNGAGSLSSSRAASASSDCTSAAHSALDALAGVAAALADSAATF